MKKVLLAVIGMVFIGASVGLAARLATPDDDKDEDTRTSSLEQAPAGVRKTLSRLAGKSKIRSVTIEDEDGVRVYEGSWKVGDVQYEASVTEEGFLLEREQSVRMKAVPTAVRAAARNAFPEGADVSVERKVIVLYEIEGEVNGKEREMLVAPTGQRVEIERDDDDDEGRDDDND